MAHLNPIQTDELIATARSERAGNMQLARVALLAPDIRAAAVARARWWNRFIVVATRERQQ